MINQRLTSKNERMCSSAGSRYLFTELVFMGFVVIYSSRVTMYVAIVAMVRMNTTYKEYAEIGSDECPLPDVIISNNSSLQENSAVREGEFSWSPPLQGYILGSYWNGYMFAPILGGRLAEIYNAKWVFGTAVFITSLLTLLTPIAARHSVAALVATRIIAGFLVGSALPGTQTMFAQWFAESERGFLSSIVYSGVNIGVMFGMAVSGALCKSDFLGGWPSVFYVMGFIGCIWFIFWIFFIPNSASNSDQVSDMNKKIPPLPWSKMLTSAPFWSLIFMNFGIDWYFDICSVVLPTYLGTILHVNIQDNGLYSSLSNLPALFVSLIIGVGSDALINKKFIGRIAVRKLSSAATGFGAALAILGVCLAECDIPLSISFLTISKFFNGFVTNGYVVGIVELSPEYAGTITGIAYTLSSASGFLVPLLVGYLTKEEQTLRQWRIVFGITIYIMSVGTLFFLISYTTENQNWIEEKEKCSKSRKKRSFSICNECVTLL